MIFFQIHSATASISPYKTFQILRKPWEQVHYWALLKVVRSSTLCNHLSNFQAVRLLGSHFPQLPFSFSQDFSQFWIMQGYLCSNFVSVVCDTLPRKPLSRPFHSFPFDFKDISSSDILKSSLVFFLPLSQQFSETRTVLSSKCPNNFCSSVVRFSLSYCQLLKILRYTESLQRSWGWI